MYNVIITGNEGYIGSHLYKKLSKHSMIKSLYGIDLKSGPSIQEALTLENIEWGKDNKFDYVFHLAAFPRVEYSVQNPKETFYHNVYATQCVLEFARLTGIKKVIFSSSSAVYGDGKGPTSPYGLQKLQAEMLCKYYSENYGLDTVSLRYFNVYSEDQPTDGAYSTVIAAWIEKLKLKEDLIINGDGEHKRDFIHVDDIVDINIAAAFGNGAFKGLAIDIGTGKNYSLNEIKAFIEKKDYSKNFIYGPERLGDAKKTLADTRFQHSLGWNHKISFEEGLERCFGEKNIKIG